ncbi:MAG: argininosuccinate lyase [Candidatus Marinimicrobia bacterium]|nr:argininosuccinate lyase [Candidatus Neomarinimicrobiota bacterium]
MKMKLWNKGYTLDEIVEDYTVGRDYILDQRLVEYDCRASITHAEMLHEIDILTENEKNQLIKELKNIISLHKNGDFKIEKSEEDCHTAIENHLTKKLGDTGKKIHTARSRNDQVLTALRLYYRDEIKNIEELINENIKSIKKLIDKYGDIEFPGYTHTRKAMPSSIAMWAGGLRDSMRDNLDYLKFYAKFIDQSPLGTAAGYGAPLNIKRDYTAGNLGFERVQENPVYCQNSRGKFESGLASIFKLVMYDLNKYASDLILFSMPGCQYFSLPDKFLTGSSIMPHKKNPDVLELMRAKYHIVVSLENRISSMMANLITGYHRDFQLFKEAIFEVFDITHASLRISANIFDSLKVNKDKCEEALTDELYATEKAYKLVKQGVPFREAYRQIASQY